MYFVLKILISAFLIALISEVSKRSTLLGAILTSLPIISILAFIWLYIDTQDVEKISKLSYSIFWLVIPSLVLFIALPLFLKFQVNFTVSLLLSIILTVISYFIMIIILERFGVKL